MFSFCIFSGWRPSLVGLSFCMFSLHCQLHVLAPRLRREFRKVMPLLTLAAIGHILARTGLGRTSRCFSLTSAIFTSDGLQPSGFLLLVGPGAPIVASLLLVVMPGATSSDGLQCKKHPFRSARAAILLLSMRCCPRPSKDVLDGSTSVIKDVTE